MMERAITESGLPRGFLITFEGIEGTGKSTHLRFLAERLEAEGCRVVCTREPGGTPLGEALRDLLLAPGEDSPVPEAELFLLLASRAQHVRRRILPALDAGNVVLCDRFADASVAYQGAGRKLGTDRVAEWNRVATGGLQPDLTLLLDVDVAEAVRRVEKRRHRTGNLDRMDAETAAFFTAVQDAYHALARAEPDRFVVLSTTRSKRELAEDVWRAVEPRLRERRARGCLC